MEGFTGNSFEYAIDPADTDKIFTGDLVNLASGYAQEATQGGTIGSLNDFAVLGVFTGCRYVASDGSYTFRNYWDGAAGKTNAFAMVAIPVNSLFHIKGAVGQTYTQADIGVRKGVLYNAGSTKFGDSRVTLGAAGATVATGPLFVHGLAKLPGNSFSSAEPIFEVSVVRQLGFGSTPV